MEENNYIYNNNDNDMYLKCGIQTNSLDYRI